MAAPVGDLEELWRFDFPALDVNRGIISPCTFATNSKLQIRYFFLPPPNNPPLPQYIRLIAMDECRTMEPPEDVQKDIAAGLRAAADHVRALSLQHVFLLERATLAAGVTDLSRLRVLELFSCHVGEASLAAFLANPSIQTLILLGCTVPAPAVASLEDLLERRYPAPSLPPPPPLPPPPCGPPHPSSFDPDPFTLFSSSSFPPHAPGRQLETLSIGGLTVMEPSAASGRARRRTDSNRGFDYLLPVFRHAHFLRNLQVKQADMTDEAATALQAALRLSDSALQVVRLERTVKISRGAQEGVKSAFRAARRRLTLALVAEEMATSSRLSSAAPAAAPGRPSVPGASSSAAAAAAAAAATAAGGVPIPASGPIPAGFRRPHRKGAHLMFPVPPKLPELTPEEAEEARRNFPPGTIVWAKQEGFPWWPAVVFAPGSFTKDKEYRAGYVCVQYYNEAWRNSLHPSKVLHFGEHFQRLKNQRFKEKNLKLQPRFRTACETAWGEHLHQASRAGRRRRGRPPRLGAALAERGGPAPAPPPPLARPAPAAAPASSASPKIKPPPSPRVVSAGSASSSSGAAAGAAAGAGAGATGTSRVVTVTTPKVPSFPSSYPRSLELRGRIEGGRS
eukprot:tig00021037_g17482.t1